MWLRESEITQLCCASARLKTAGEQKDNITFSGAALCRTNDAVSEGLDNKENIISADLKVIRKRRTFKRA